MQVRDHTVFRIRIHPELHERLKRDAKSGYRSMNAEITMILEKHFAETQKETNEAQLAGTPSSVSAQ